MTRLGFTVDSLGVAVTVERKFGEPDTLYIDGRPYRA